eukprot:CAMPEP_0119564890 /NCGR_PEP_ID=MMETSP1352-20130426/28314_1 /TAXON_ID=265584 /ORGANISM="Stauroneis constricta, Strain CCMP1120" /LENGTH=45 /DNA_ID= /DNA_START= /DNA_END= /DNA_ORIENTATION=
MTMKRMQRSCHVRSTQSYFCPDFRRIVLYHPPAQIKIDIASDYRG